MALNLMDYIEEVKDQRGQVVDCRLKPAGQTLTQEVIEQPNRTDRLVDFSEAFGTYLAKAGEQQRLTTSQIRNIFGEVKKIEMDWGRKPEASWARLQLLRPKLAYTAKRENRSRLFALREVLSSAVVQVKGDAGNFQRFVDFFEAILAYHRAAGGQ